MHRWTINAGLVVAFIFVGCRGASVPGSDAPVNVDICSVTATPTKYDDRTITIHATVLSARRAALIDPHCQLGIAMRFADDIEKDSEKELLGIVSYGTINRKVEGNFTGVFRYRPKRFWQRRNPFDPWRVLEVREVSHLAITGDPTSARSEK